MNEQTKMNELVARLQLCNMKTERTIGMTKDVLSHLDELKKEQKDINDLIKDWLGEKR